MINLYNEYNNDLRLEEITQRLFNEYSKTFSEYKYIVDVTIVDNEEIKNINNENRSINKSTDVLSFPMNDGKDGILSISDCDVDDEGNLFLGDIIISYDKVISQAEEYGHTFIREYAFLLSHGLLHLYGYDHDTKEREILMRQVQEKILNQEGYTR